MTTPLDVMVLESSPGGAMGAVAELVAAGHRVHRCHEPGDRGFPCKGITEPDACPLVVRPDVALLVRRRVAPRPTPLEDGVTCAIRAGVPVVEDGPAILDPFDPWLAGRVTGDVVSACEDAARPEGDVLRSEIRARIGRLLAGAGVPGDAVAIAIEAEWPRLRVQLRGPAVEPALRRALAVRVLDAVRGGGRTYGSVDVGYEAVGGEEALDGR